MNRTYLLFAAAAVVAGLPSTAARAANDIPTAERVEFVLECMRANPGSRQEMLYKCSCTLDELNRTLTHEQFVDGSTAANAMSIGGERGAVLRESEGAKAMATAYRGLLAKAKQACFLN